jgi:Protein of unknown function (DUF2752)
MSHEEAALAPVRRVALRAERGAFPIGAALGAAAAVGATGVMLLGTYHVSFVVCYFKLITGLPCLTCGGTRATARLLRLDPAGALAMNPLVTLVGFAVAAWAVADLVLLTRGRALRMSVGPPVARALRIAIPLAVVANWAYLIAAGR